MCEVNDFKIDLEGIRKSFRFDKKINHSHGEKYKLLPYKTKDANIVNDFSGVIGSISRLISNKKLNDEFKVEEFIEEVADNIGEYQGDTNREYFKDIIRTMFIDNDNLVNFDIKTINYIKSTSDDEKIANFIYSVLFNEDIKNDVRLYYDKKVENIMYNLVLKSLPKLEEKEVPLGQYKCYLPFVREQFIKDFRFLLSKEELYKDSLKRFIEYYYMFYVSQLIIKLENFERADITKPDKLYYTLGWEKTGKTRTAYQFGWEKIKNNVYSLFSHAIVLELLNHNNMEEQLGYKDLEQLFSNSNKESIDKEIQCIINDYKNAVNDIDWTKFKKSNKQSSVNGFNLIYELFDIVRYQFENSSRSGPNRGYGNWFVKYVEKNFAKRRGPLGYNLNMTEDDIILMTKICINNNEKLKLNELFEEFELRGLFFDRDSKTKIVELYEKLNLLEKKSDSGDAQYVKSVL